MSPADALLAALRACEGPVLLTGPVSPDGDSLGACLALARVLVADGVDARVAGSASYRYQQLPGIETVIPDKHIRGPFAAVVVLDGDRHRLTPQALRAFESADVVGIIDHHASTENDGYDFAWLESDAASTCEMVQRQLQAEGRPLDDAMAELLYVGMVFDTGCFRFSNTTSTTHLLAAELVGYDFDHAAVCSQVLYERRPEALRVAGAVYAEARFEEGLAVGRVSRELQRRVGLLPGDLEGLVESLVHVHDISVAVLLIERRPGTVKLSLRSRGSVDVAALAKQLAPTGGGHAKAAGVSVPDAAVGEAIELLRRAVAAIR